MSGGGIERGSEVPARGRFGAGAAGEESKGESAMIAKARLDEVVGRSQERERVCVCGAKGDGLRSQRV